MGTLFSSQTIKKTVADVKQKQDEYGGDKRPSLPGGENIVVISNAELTTTKSSGKSMLVLTFTKTGDFKPLKANFVLEQEISQQQIISLLLKSFNYELQECDEAGLLQQILKFKNKSLKIAVKLREDLFVKDNGGMVIAKKSEFWYSGHIDDINFSVDPVKILVEMPQDQKVKYMNWKNQQPQSGVSSQPAQQHKEEEIDPLTF